LGFHFFNWIFVNTYYPFEYQILFEYIGVQNKCEKAVKFSNFILDNNTNFWIIMDPN